MTENILLKTLILKNICKYGEKSKLQSIINKLHFLKIKVTDKKYSLIESFFKESLLKDRTIIFKELQTYSSICNFENIERKFRKITCDTILSKIQPRTKYVLRYSPNPNGPPTFMSMKGFIINDYICKNKKGCGNKLFLRFDDTDPLNKLPTILSYKSYISCYKWLGIKIDSIIYSSDNLLIYYYYCYKLLKDNILFCCTCTQNEFKELKDKNKHCSCRKNLECTNLKIFRDIIDKLYLERSVVIRFRSDNNVKKSMKDWVCFRIIISKKHILKPNYILWPTLIFQTAIDDYINNVNYIIRGIDLESTELKQKHLYDKLGWKYPTTCYWGLSFFKGYKISTSIINLLVKNGDYKSFDDYRILGFLTLKFLKFSPIAVYKFFVDLGLSRNYSQINIEKFFNYNRKFSNPVKIKNVMYESDILKPLKFYKFLKEGINILKIPSKVFKTMKAIKNKVMVVENIGYFILKNNTFYKLHD